MSEGQQDAPCSECKGATVEFRGSGLNAEYKVCSRWKQPGHLLPKELRQKMIDNYLIPGKRRWA